jgi:hypothetical protein
MGVFYPTCHNCNTYQIPTVYVCYISHHMLFSCRHNDGNVISCLRD